MGLLDTRDQVSALTIPLCFFYLLSMMIHNFTQTCS